MNDVDQDVRQYRAALTEQDVDLHSLYNEITPTHKHSSGSRFCISR